MKHLFIVNPDAGKGKAVRYVESIEKYFQKSKEPYYIEFTKGPGDATEIARKHTSTERYRVYSVGGDGTLNEVLNGVMNSSSSLAVIPSGSGNDFLRSMGVGFNSSLLYRTINGEEKYIDVGRVNDRYFVNVASVGIDAEVVYNARKFKKLPLLSGMGAYVAGIFYTVFKYKSFNSTININNINYSRQTLLLAVANGKYYGGGMKIAPRADLTDEHFDIYHIDRANPLKIIFLFPKLIKGRHESIKEVAYYKSRNVKISSDESFLLNIDGEIFETKEAEFEIIHNGLKLVVPSKDFRNYLFATDA
ncbi:MAG: diacylglycerol kinase family lipid kinase [Clostridium sp.]|jgi:YegS/Rv2252/BmrU family lipid kinase|nr:diacylglycerol kinase family lipid kinase [Clostridium sp.]